MDRPIRHLPPLSRLKPFEAAARHESFSAAAAELGMTQTAISKQIALLESELGLPLFERRNRAVFLTQPGRRLGQVVSAALAEISTEVAFLTGHQRSGEIVLLSQLCEAFYWLMPRLARFHERYPDIELRIVSTLDPLTETTEPFDVAIQTTGRASGTARLAFTAADEIFPVCAPGLIPERDCPLDPVDLVEFPLLSHRVDPQDWLDWRAWFEHAGLVLPTHARQIEFNSYPLALQAAAAGRGIALGWRRTTEFLREEGKLIRPCAESVSRPKEISVFRGETPNKRSKTDKLVAWLQEELSD